MRYDVDSARAASAGLGLAYRNECVSRSIFPSRVGSRPRLVSMPTTNVGLPVSLNGFGGSGGDSSTLGRCSG